MYVWLLYRKSEYEWDGSTSTDLLGVFTTPQKAVNYARKDRVSAHSAPSGPLVPSEPITPDTQYASLNERYTLHRETTDPSNAGHVCSIDTCISVIG